MWARKADGPGHVTIMTAMHVYGDDLKNVPHHKKICFLHMRKTAAQISCVTMQAVQHLYFSLTQYEPRREKTGFLHMRKQRRRSASR